MSRLCSVFLQAISRHCLSVMYLVLMCLVVLSGGINRHVEAYGRYAGPRSAETFLTVAKGPECFLRTKYVKQGKWRTLEKFWNAKGTAFFKAPKGARIKVRYGKFLGKDRQKKTLDGWHYTKLSVGGWSVSYARMQMRVTKSTPVTYVMCPGGVGLNSPTIRF